MLKNSLADSEEFNSSFFQNEQQKQRHPKLFQKEIFSSGLAREFYFVSSSKTKEKSPETGDNREFRAGGRFEGS